MPHIAFVCGDADGTEYLVPTIIDFKVNADSGFTSVVFSDPEGSGKRVLEEAGISHCSGGQFCPDKGPSIIVCGTTCKAHNLLRGATQYGHEHHIPVIWCEDFWATSCDPAVMDIAPDHMIVIDESAAHLVRRNRPSFPLERIHALGRPDFDRYATMKKDARLIRRKVHDSLLIQKGQHLVCFWSTDTSQINFMEGAEPFLSTIREDPSVVVFAGFHPADQNKETLKRIVRAVLGKDRVRFQAEFTYEELALASLFGVTQFSTFGVKASYLGVPMLFLLTPSCQSFLEDGGNEKPYFPLISAGACAVAYTEDDVEQETSRLLYNDFFRATLREALKHEFTLPQDATEKVCAFIRECAQ